MTQTRKKRMCLIAGLAGAFVLAMAVIADAQSQTRVDRVSNSDFAQTANRVETALKSRSMMIVATIDHQNMLRMVGANIKGSRTIEFGNPNMGKMTVVPNPESGLEMPARIYVWEREDGKTVVSYYRPAAAFAAYGKENLTQAGQMMDKTLDEVVTEATR